MNRLRVSLFLRWLLACAAVAPPGTGSAQKLDRTVVLVALDGFHPGYLDRAPSRHLRRLAQVGVRARWLVPVFPTVTFPNFYSIATGLYPERHGIVSNNMRDSALGRFALGDSVAVRDPRWWGGEPIWATAVTQGKRAATFFWPGSDVPIGGVRPTYYKLYDPRIPNAERVRQVLEWLSLPADSVPSLVTLYLGDVDQAGHEHGPDGPETDSAIARVDSAVGGIMSGIVGRGLERRVNLIVVSDHGMARLDPRQVVYLDDYLEPGSFDLIDRGGWLALSPLRGTAEDIYRRLRGAHPRLTVYRKSELPAKYHYREHPRIPPILGLVDEGWAVTTRRAAALRKRVSLGDHGYPPERASMRAIFLARGPAFRKGAVVEPFENIHTYALLAHLLDLKPAPSDAVLDSVKAVLIRPVQ